MKIRRLQDTLKIFIIFLGLLYALVPFETSNSKLTYAIHAAALLFIMIYALIVADFKVKINRLGRITLVILIFFNLVALLISYEKVGLIFAFSIIFSSITASIIYNDPKFRKQFLLALKWLIIFSISILFIQIIVLNISGSVVRIHEIIYPFSKARISVSEEFNNLYRMGGIYIEPGTYSNMVYMFLIIYLVISKNISKPILIVGAISIILSYSVWGMVFGSYLLILFIFAKIKSSSFKKKVLILFTILLTGFVSFSYLSKRPEINYAINKVNSDTNSVVYKEQVYLRYKNNFDSFLLIGEGFLPPFNIGLKSVQDSGFILNLSVVFGILFTILILIIYSVSILKCCDKAIFFASLPIFMGKFFYWDTSFWLLFFLVIYGGGSFINQIK